MSEGNPQASRTAKGRAKKRVLVASPDRYVASDLARLIKRESGLIGDTIIDRAAFEDSVRQSRPDVVILGGLVDCDEMVEMIHRIQSGDGRAAILVLCMCED